MASPDLFVPKDQYFVAAKAIVVGDDGLMLTMLRGATAPTHPLHWDLPGGILEYGEAIEECVARETDEEAGIKIDSIRVFHAFSRGNSLGEFWTTVFFAARALSQDVRLSWEHDEFKWIGPEEFLNLQGSQRNKEAVALFIELRDQGKL